MKYCEYCGKEIPDDSKLCPYCGASVTGGTGAGGNRQAGGEGGQGGILDTEDVTNTIDAVDINNNKLMGVLAYISLLVLIPIFCAKDSKFARFHANQGLVLFAAEVVLSAARFIIANLIGWLPLVGGLALWAVNIVFGLAGIGTFILSIIGIINVVNGRAKRLPVIGGINILN